MSGRNRRAEYRRQARRPSKLHRTGELDTLGTPIVDFAETAVIAGWCSDAGTALEECKAATHDAIIAMLAKRRTSGVTWNVYEPDEARDVLSRMMALEYELPDPHGTAQALLIHYRTLAGKLRAYGGLLVLALADGTPEPRKP